MRTEMPSSDLSDLPLSCHDSLLRRDLETLYSVPVLFIEGEMQRMQAGWVWCPSELVLFPYAPIETRQSRRIKWVTRYYGTRARPCWDRNQAVLWDPRMIHGATLSLMFPTACVKQVPNAVFIPHECSNWLRPFSSWLLLVWGLLVEIMRLDFTTWRWLHFSTSWKHFLGFCTRKNFPRAPSARVKVFSVQVITVLY